MAKTRANEHAHKNIHEEGVEFLVGYLLVLVELGHQQRAQQQAHEPTHGIPPHAKGTHMEYHL